MKQIILIGRNKKDSLGKIIATHFFNMNWECWLCSRNNEYADIDHLHIRNTDLSNYTSIKKLLNEVAGPDIVCLFADTPTYNFNEMSEIEIVEKLNAKLLGTVLMVKAILNQNYDKTIQIVIGAGSIGLKKDPITIYSMINNGLYYFCQSINDQYPQIKVHFYEMPFFKDLRLSKKYLEKYTEKNITLTDISQVFEYFNKIKEKNNEKI